MGDFNFGPLLNLKFNMSIVRHTETHTVIPQLPHQEYEHQCHNQEITLTNKLNIVYQCLGDGYFISFGTVLHL